MNDQTSEKQNAGDMVKGFLQNRKGIVIRLAYTFIFVIVLGVVTNIVWVIAAFQYLFLLATRSYIKPLRNFSGNLTNYLKEVIDYVLLTTNKKPFPFNEFPKTDQTLDPLDIEDIKE